jgi:hypothetical protein
MRRALYPAFCVMATTIFLGWMVVVFIHKTYFLATAPACSDEFRAKGEGDCYSGGGGGYLEEMRVSIAEAVIGKTAVIANLHVESTANTTIKSKSDLGDLWMIGSDVVYTGKGNAEAGLAIEPSKDQDRQP